MKNCLRRLSPILLLPLLAGLVMLGSVGEMLAQNKVTFSLLNRRAVGVKYYAELWATVASSQTWQVGNSTIAVYYNMAALEATNANQVVSDPDPALSGGSYGTMVQGPYGPNATKVDIINFFGPYASKTGSFKIGTFEWTVLNPTAMDNLAIAVPPALDGSIVFDAATAFGYDCGNNSCYGVSNPTSRIIGLPVITAEPTESTVCSGQPASFAVSAVGNNLTYQWQYATTTTGSFSNITGADAATLSWASVTTGNAGAYRVVITNTTGSVTSNIATLTVNTVPVVTTAPSNQTVCSGGDAVFTVAYTSSITATVQWQKFDPDFATWNDVAGETGTTLTLTAVTTAQSGDQYRAHLTNACGVTDTEAGTLTVNTPPVINLTPISAAGCVGTNVIFRANANGSPLPTVEWQVSTNAGVSFVSTGVNTTTLTVSNVQTSQNNNQYRAVFTNSCGVVTTASAVLTVNTAPVVDTNPVSQTVCEGAAVSFSAAATGSPAPTVQWQVSTNGGGAWTNISGQTSITLTLSNVLASQSSNQYRAVFTNVCGTVNSDAAVLSVNTSPVVVTDPASQTQCENGSVTFTASANSTPAPTVQWQVNTSGTWNDISGAVTGSLTVSNILPSQDGNQYRAVFTNTCGTINSAAAVLTVTVAPKVATVAPVSPVICAGSPVTLTASETGSTPVATVQWQSRPNSASVWADISGATDVTYSFTVAVADNGSEYRAIFSNVCGNTTSNVSVLTVTDIPSVTMNPADAAQCVGGSVSFTAAGVGTPAPTVQWQVSTNDGVNFTNLVDGGDISGAQTGTLTVSNVAVNNPLYRYRAVFTNTCGSVNSAAAVLTVNTAPTITQNPATTEVCAGSEATFTAAATSAAGTPTVQWEISTNGGASFTVIPGATSTTYTFTAGPNDDGNQYRARFTNACGNTLTEAATLNFYALPEIIQQPTAVAVCQGESFTLTVGGIGTGLTYQWRKDGIDIPGANAASYTVAAATIANGGFYTVVVSNICNQPVTSNPVNVVVNINPVISVQPAPVTVCQDDFAQFSVQATGTGLSYQWRKDDVNIPGATNTFYTIASAQPADAAVYTVVITGACGSPITSDAARLTVETAPVITRQPAAVTVCEGKTATFTVTAEGSNLTYQWQFDGNDIIGANSDSFVINGVTPAQAGAYSVVVSGSCGTPVTSNAATLTVNTAPAIVSQPQSQEVCEGRSVTFSVTATGTGLTYQWFYNSLPISGAQSSSYTISPVGFANAGDYYVAITGVCSEGGSTDSRVASLTVYENVAIIRQPKSVSACLGDNIVLSVAASGTGFSDGLHYQWYKDGQPIPAPTGTGNQLTISNAQYIVSGNYSVAVTGVCGTVTSDDAIVVINRPTTAIIKEPKNKRVSAGDDVVFEVSDVSNIGTTFQWFKNNVAMTDVPGKILGTQSSKLHIYNAQASDESNSYHVVVNGPCGQATSELASLNIFNPSLTFEEEPQSATACAGGDIILTGLASTNVENGVITYQWYKNGVAITGATQRILSLNNLTVSDSGTYRLEATETTKTITATSANAVVTVRTAPMVTALSTTSVRACEGENVSITVTVNAEAGAVTYQWSKDGTPISAALNPTATTATLVGPVNAFTVGNYAVTIANECGFVTSGDVSVGMKTATVITKQPVAAVNLDTLGVTPLRLSVEVAGENCSYQWMKDGNDILDATASEFVLGAPTSSDLGNYSVRIICECGTTTSTVAVVTGFTVDVDEPVTGEGFYLSQNYPNPFGGSTTIRYQVPASVDVRLTVTDMYGREVAVLVNGVVPAGVVHSVKFDAGQLPSGTYFYTMTAGGIKTSRRMLLVK